MMAPPIINRVPKGPASGRASGSAIGLTLAAVIVAAWLGLHAVALFAFTLTWETLVPALAIAAVLCWLSVGLFIVSHDAMHGSLAPGMPRVNARIGASLLFLYAGFSWDKLRAAHFEHHRHAGTSRDPDFDAQHPRNFWAWYATFLRRYFGLGSLVYVVAVFWALHMLGGVPLAQVILFYAVPSIASSLQLFYFGTFRPHRHASAPFADQHNARSESFGTLASLVTCFHFGYHLEHHHHPGTPWWALPARRRNRVKASAPASEGLVSEGNGA